MFLSSLFHVISWRPCPSATPPTVFINCSMPHYNLNLSNCVLLKTWELGFCSHTAALWKKKSTLIQPIQLVIICHQNLMSLVLLTPLICSEALNNEGCSTWWWVLLLHTKRGGAVGPIFQMCCGHHGNREGQREYDEEESEGTAIYPGWISLERKSWVPFSLGELPIKSKVAVETIASNVGTWREIIYTTTLRASGSNFFFLLIWNNFSASSKCFRT